MASRLKEDDKNERIIRGLLKQTANRKCINCNSMGPQYVCTTFSTFVCTTCSGIHREFTHRVKSISMAKFTPQEVGALQAGGNERARELYFKEWDAQRHATPDSSNVDRLRDFIKHVYVDKRYTGERSLDRPPRMKTGEREESYENRRADGYQSGSRSPSYEDTYERRYSDRSSPGYEGRSPGNDQDNQRHSDYGRSPGRPGVVNDWRREDRFANGRRSEDRRSSSDGDFKSDGRSPEHQRDLNVSSPPLVRPVRDILGENVIPLRISEPPRANGGRTTDGAVLTQRTTSSNSLASTNENPVELKREASLIDFDADPEPPVPSTQTRTPTAAVNQSVANTTSPSESNWASFDNAPVTKVTQAPSNVNSLESMFTQLSVPAPISAPGLSSGGSVLPAAPPNSVSSSAFIGDSLFNTTGHPTSLMSVSAPAAQLVGSSTSFLPVGLSAPPSGGAPTALLSSVSALPANSGTAQWNVQHQQQSLFPNIGPGNTVQQASRAVTGPAEASAGVTAKPLEMNSAGRRELPEDLFAAKYPIMYAASPGWQAGLAPGMGFPVQYNAAAFMPTFQQPIKSVNPFDVGGEASHSQVVAFPSVASLQAALPNMGPSTGLMRTSSLGTAAPLSMPPQPSVYPSAVPPQSFSSAMTPGSFTGQQALGNYPPSRYQPFGGIRDEGSFLGSSNPNLDIGGKFSVSRTPSSSVGGNPFG